MCSMCKDVTLVGIGAHKKMNEGKQFSSTLSQAPAHPMNAWNVWNVQNVRNVHTEEYPPDTKVSIRYDRAQYMNKG